MNRIYEQLPLLALISQDVANTPVFSGWVAAGNLHEIFGEFLLGDMANETVDVAIYQATDSGGSGAKALKAGTQRTASASANDGKVIQISALAEQMDHANGFTHIALRAVTGNTSGGSIGATLRGRMRSLTASQQVAAVVETAVA